LGLAGFFLAIVLISREKWMGMGDAKLGFLMGLLLGWPDVIVALFLAVFIGAIMGIGLIVMGKKGMKSEVPFGPFLVTGTFIALFWADRLINWYFNFFGYL
jgi:prepilin signal peptidase PulO-like enzyme (type II secretory pathway)